MGALLCTGFAARANKTLRGLQSMGWHGAAGMGGAHSWGLLLGEVWVGFSN